MIVRENLVVGSTNWTYNPNNPNIDNFIATKIDGGWRLSLTLGKLISTLSPNLISGKSGKTITVSTLIRPSRNMRVRYYLGNTFDVKALEWAPVYKTWVVSTDSERYPSISTVDPIEVGDWIEAAWFKAEEGEGRSIWLPALSELSEVQRALFPLLPADYQEVKSF